GALLGVLEAGGAVSARPDTRQSATPEPAAAGAAATTAESAPPPAPPRAAANPPAGVHPPPRPLGPVSRPASPPATGAAHAPLPAAAKIIEEQHLTTADVEPGTGKDG